MSRRWMNGLAASTLVVLSIGCASGAADSEEIVQGTSSGDGGAGGTGGAGGGTASTNSSSSHSGGAAGAGGSSTTGSTSSTGTATGTGTTTGTGTGTGTGTSSGGCPALEHKCNNVCMGNTPQTGCFTSSSCSPCAAPANATATCSAQGICDSQCNPGYTKSGSACICQSGCCSDSDCGSGKICKNGSCQATSCDPPCAFQCFGIGFCTNGVCDCW